MKFKNLILKAQVGANLGSLAASVFLKGHDQNKNEEIITKVNKIFGIIHTMNGNDLDD